MMNPVLLSERILRQLEVLSTELEKIPEEKRVCSCAPEESI